MEEELEVSGAAAPSTFISYARVDSVAVDALHGALEALGVRVWRDTSDIQPAAEWLVEVEAAIDRNGTFVAVLSSSYFESEMCRRELNRAREMGKAVVPVMLNRVELPPEFGWIGEINWIVWSSETTSDRVAGLVLKAASTDREWMALHTRLLIAATDWESAHRPSDRLLRGRDIDESGAALAVFRPPSQPQPVELQRVFVEASRAARRRRASVAIVATAAVVACALALAAVAFVQRGRAETALDREAVARSAEEAKTLIARSWAEDDTLAAALLALEAEYRTSPPLAEARAAWAEAIVRYSSTGATAVSPSLRTDQSESAVWSPRGDAAAVVSASYELTVRSADGTELTESISISEVSWPVWTDSGDEVVVVDDTGDLLVVTSNGDVIDTGLRGVVDVLGVSPDAGQVALRLEDGSASVVSLVEGDAPSVELWMDADRVVWHPDGTRFLAGSSEALGDGVNYVWHAYTADGNETGAELVGPSFRSTAQAAWNPTSEVFAGVRFDGSLIYTSAATGNVVGESSGGGSSVVECDWSPDGSAIALGLEDGSVVIDSGFGAERRSLLSGDGGAEVTALAWRPDGNQLAVGWSDGRSMLLTPAGEAVGEPTYGRSGDAVDSVTWWDEGSLLVDYVTEATGAHSWRVMRPGEGAVVGASGFGEDAEVVEWSPTGDRIAVGSGSGLISVFSPDGTLLAGPVEANDAGLEGSRVRSIEWSPDGQHLISLTDIGGRALFTADLGTRVIVQQYDEFGYLGKASWSPDSTRVVFIGNSGDLTVLDVDGDEVSANFSLEGLGQQNLSGEAVWLSDERLALGLYDGIAIVGRPGIPGLPRRVAIETDRLVWSSALKALVVGTSAGSVGLVSADGEVVVEPIPLGLDYVVAVEVSHQGLVAVSGGTSRITVVDPIRGSSGSIDLTSVGEVEQMAWNATGDVLAVVASQSQLLLADVSDPDLPVVIEAPVPPVASLAWSPDQSSLARVEGSGVVAVGHSWSESDFCEYAKSVLSRDEMDAAVGLGAGGSLCGSGVALTELPLLPVATRASIMAADAAPPVVPASPSTTVEPAPSTTLDAEAEKAAAQAALDLMAEQMGAIDYSRLSVGECGIFAMTVQTSGLRFFEWTVGEWSERTELLATPFEVPPRIVTTNDYTGDGARDFLVAFNGEALGGREFGAIFSNWQCNWAWFDILSLGGDFVTALDGLTYQDGMLIATDYLPEGGRGGVYLLFNREGNYFFAERL